MPNDVAFLPWVSIREPIAIGPLRLLPYARGTKPGDLPGAVQTDLDAILGAYADRPGYPVHTAAILELGPWYTGMDSSEHMSALFRTRAFMGFAALARRRLFASHFGYTNYDTYFLSIQRYNPGKASSFSFTTRRRDGATHHMWTADHFAFQRPSHVDSRARVELDSRLLETLLDMGDSRPKVTEAIVEFNSANTDSQDVPPHVEVVMVKSAFEWLLNVNTDADSFVEALMTTVGSVLEKEVPDGPLARRWRERWPKAKRPIEAWARDFCDVRGAAAHGKPNKADRFVWQNRSHLAFTSILFPLVLKKWLADERVHEMTAADHARLRRAEQFLMYDPLDPTYFVDQSEHPWAGIEDDGFIEVAAERLYSQNSAEHPEAPADDR